MNQVRPYPGTQAVLRALRLLKSFHSDQPELGLAELTRRSGLNRTTVFRLLTALESEGMLERNPKSDAWRLGPQLAALGSRANPRIPLSLRSAPGRSA